MSYQLECQFCNHRIEVTDPAAPAAAQCPECASFHTLVPATDRPPLSVFSVIRSVAPIPDQATAPPAAPRPALPAGCTPPARITGWHPELVAARMVTPVGLLDHPAAPGPPLPVSEPGPRLGILEVGPPAAARKGVPVAKPLTPATRLVVPDGREEYEPPETPFLLRAAGPGAFLLACAALACVTFPPLHGLAAPLCAVGFLAGLAGAAVDDGTRRSRLVPSAGAAACGLLLLFFIVPDFDFVFRSGRPGAAVDPAALRVVPLTGDSLEPGVDDGGWVDASRAAVQRHKVGVQVVSVTLAPAEVRAAPVPHPIAQQRHLIIRLRTQRVWGGEEVLTDKPDADPPPAGPPRATLTDDTGKVYPPLPVAADEAGSGRKPGGFGEEAFAFEAPPPGHKFLRLEVSAAAWGGTGSFRFKIPNAMIRPEPAKPARPGPRAGARVPTTP
jgi:hypothetical protein